jgi:hypothetical protein
MGKIEARVAMQELEGSLDGLPFFMEGSSRR